MKVRTLKPVSATALAVALMASPAGAVVLDGPLLVTSGTTLVGTSLSGSTAVVDGPADTLLVVDGSAASLSLSGQLSVGVNQQGGLNVTNGAYVASNGGTLGQSSGAIGSVVLSGGSEWDAGTGPNSGPLNIGMLGQGSIDISEGSTLRSGQASLASFGSGKGTVTISGAGSQWINSGLVLVGQNGGGQGTGTIVSVLDGGLFQTDRLSIGGDDNFYGAGQVRVSGAGSSLVVNSLLNVGHGSTGTLVVANGGTVDVEDGGASGAGTLTIAANAGSIGTLIIGADQTEAAEGAGAVNAANIVFGSGLGRLVLNHTDDDYVLSSNISGDGSVNVYGGTTSLTGTNSYGGGTFIHGGVLEIASEASLGTGVVEIGGGSSRDATLRFSADTDFTRALYLSSNSAILDTADRDVTVSGVISGAPMVSLRKAGSGTLRLTATNSYQANTWLDAGTLVGNFDSFGGGFIVTADDTTLVLDQATDATFANQVRGSGAFIKKGAGIVDLTGENGFTGGMVVEQGTVTTSVSGGFGAGAVDIRAGTAAYLNGSAAAGRVTVANSGTFGLAGAASAAQASVVNAAGGVLTIAALTAPGTSIGGVSGAGAVVLGDRALTLGGLDGNDTISGVISGNGGSLVKVGTGTLTLTGANSYSGGTTLSAGTLALGSVGALGTGGLAMAGGTTLDYLVGASMPDQMGLMLDGDVRLNVGAGIDANQNGAIGGSGGFEKTGDGTLHLWSPAVPQADPQPAYNLYTGNTLVSAGSLVLHGPDAVGDQSAVTVAAGATLALSSQYYGNGETIGSLSGTGIVDLGTRALTVGANDGSTGFSGVIQGSGAFIKTGTGTLTLSGAQSYTGSTYVEGGRLLVDGQLASGYVGVDAGGALGGSGTIAGQVFVNSGGRLVGQSGRTLGMGDLTLASGSLIDVTLDAPGGNGLFQVNGDLRLNGATVNVTPLANTILDPGVYRLIDYSGALYNNQPLALGTVPVGMQAADLAIQTAAAGQVNLVSAQGLELKFWDGNATANLNNGLIDGGDGTWSATAHGWTDANGLVTMTMRPAIGMAIFQGVAGMVTLDGSVQTQGLQFAVDGYVLTGGQIDIGAGNTIRVGDGTADGAGFGATIASTIVGAGSLDKTDLGTLTLTGSNSYAGPTFIGAGTLVGSAGSFGSGLILNAGALVVDQQVSGILSQDISGVGSVTKTGNGALTLTGANSYRGGTVVKAGALYADAAGAFGTGPLRIDAGLVGFRETAGAGSLAITNAGATLDFKDDASAASAVITNSGQASFWNAASAGNAAITNSGGGDTNFFDTSSAGTARIDNAGAGSEIWFTDTASAGAARLTNDGGNIVFTSASSAGNAIITNTSGNIIFAGTASAGTASIAHASGIVSLLNLTGDGLAIGALSGAGNVSLAAKTLTLGGLNADNAISGTLYGDGGSLVKVGTGTLTLSGANSFTGATTVENGTLRVDGSLASGVAVKDGASLGGGGSIAGAVSIADGGRLVGQAGQTLALGSLTLDAGSVIDVTLGAPTATALFDVAGNLVLDGTLDLSDSLGFAPGVTRLFDYAGALTDNGLDIGAVPSGSASEYAVQTAVTGQVNLVNAAGLTLNFWDGGAVDHLSNGRIDGGDGRWSLAADSWTDENGLVSKSMQPQPGFAVFSGTAGTVTIDNGAGAVVTAGMQFTTDGYVLAGDALTLGEAQTIVRVGDGSGAGAGVTARIDAALTGSGGLRKTDLGTLVLAAANDYAGGTTISGGTLVGAAGSFGAGTIVNDATLVLDQAGDGTLANILSGTGVTRKTGAGTLTLSGDSGGYAGTTTVAEGSLLLTGSLGGTSAVLAGGTLQVGDGTAAGDLLGATRNDGTLIFARSDDYDYTGALAGTGALVKRGEGLLTLSGDYSYTGSTVVEGGRVKLSAVLNPETDLIVSNGDFDLGDQTQQVASLSGTGGTVTIGGQGRLTVDQDRDTEFAGGLAGNGTFVKSGSGRLNLTGTSSFTGNAIVDEGRLSVNGTLPGQVSVDDTGIIGGNGTIGGLIVQTGGTAAPGNSIGLLNVAGDVTFQSGSVYQVEAEATIGEDGFGRSDRLVASGKATLQGGTVAVIAEAGDYAPDTSYRILTAAGGVTGTFAGVTDNFAYLDSWLSYDANTVYLGLLRNDVDFAAAVATPNQRATAGAVEALSFTSPVYRAVIGLGEGEVGRAFDQLSGEIHASARTALYEDARLPRGAILSRLGTDPAGGPGVWMQGFGSWGTSDGNRNAASVDRDTTGFLIGVDTPVDDHWAIGFAAGRTDTDLASTAGSGKVESTHVLAYAGADYDGLRFKVGLGYATVDLDMNRQAAFTGFQDSLAARYDADVYQAFGELGYALPLGGGAVEPFAGFAAVKVDTEAFSETGGVARLSVDQRSETTSASTVGLRLSTPQAGAFSLKAMAGWQHAYGRLASISRARFQGGATFDIGGAPISRDAGVAEVEARFQLAPGVSLGAAYNGALGSAAQDHAVVGKLSFRF